MEFFKKYKKRMIRGAVFECLFCVILSILGVVLTFLSSSSESRYTLGIGGINTGIPLYIVMPIASIYVLFVGFKALYNKNEDYDKFIDKVKKIGDVDSIGQVLSSLPKCKYASNGELLFDSNILFYYRDSILFITDVASINKIEVVNDNSKSTYTVDMFTNNGLCFIHSDKNNIEFLADEVKKIIGAEKVIEKKPKIVENVEPQIDASIKPGTPFKEPQTFSQTKPHSFPHLLRFKNGEMISLNKPSFRIGRERDYVDYYIGDNPSISRCHAEFVTRIEVFPQNLEEYYVIDTSSMNHVFVNGAIIESNKTIRIKHGDRIRLGDEDFEFRLYPIVSIAKPSRKNNGMCIASLICGILGISILSIVFGIVGKKQVKRRKERGKGMATAGIVLGSIRIAFLMLGILSEVL